MTKSSKITDGELWENFAIKNAEFYILTRPDLAAPGERNVAAFWESGVSCSEHLLSRVIARLPAQELAIEIGCGIGRLAIPHARCFRRLVAVDVSPTMLARLTENANKTALTSIRCALATQPWCEDQTADYVYSYLVFQHIADWAVTRQYIERAYLALKNGGVAQFQFDTRTPSLLYRLRNYLPDWVLPVTWRRGIRRIRRNSEEVRRLLQNSGFRLVSEDMADSEEHIFIVEKPTALEQVLKHPQRM